MARPLPLLALALAGLGCPGPASAVTPQGGEAPPALVIPVTPGGWTADAAAARAVQVAEKVEAAAVDRIRAEAAARWRVADFAPRLDLQASYTRLSAIDSPPFSFGEITVDSPFPQILDQYGLKATLTVPVSDAFVSILPAWRAAQGGAEVARWQGLVEQQSAALGAREALYGLARVEAARLVADDAVRLLDAHLDDLDALYRAGLVTRADVLQAQARRAQAEGQQAQLAGARRVAEANLRILLDLEPDAPVGIGEDLTRDPAPPPPEAEAADGWRDRPEVQALRALVGVYEHTADAQGGQRWPRLALAGNLNYANPNQRIVPQVEEFSATWDVSVVLSWSPNAFVRGTAEREDALLQARRTRADLAALQDGLSLQLARSVADFHAARAALAAAEREVESARAAWGLETDLLRAGEATPNAVLDAEAALRRAQATLFDVRIDCHLARARIDHAVGRAVPNRGG